MKLKTTLKLASASRQLVVVLEILNEISEAEYREVVRVARSKKEHIGKIAFSAENGNVFMVTVRLRDLIEAVSFERE
jgi:hypothetical protein